MVKKALNMSTLATKYDEEYDVLYSRLCTTDSTYGEESDDGIVTLRRILDDQIVGIIIYGFKERYIDGSLCFDELPFPLDFSSPVLKSIMETE